jgi:hypothetical protein
MIHVITDSDPAPSAMIAARSMTLPPEGWVRASRVTSTRIASSSTPTTVEQTGPGGEDSSGGVAHGAGSRGGRVGICSCAIGRTSFQNSQPSSPIATSGMIACHTFCTPIR